MGQQRSTVSVGIHGMHRLVDALRADRFEVVAPVVRDGALVTRSIRSFSELPTGLGLSTAAGTARLTARWDRARFGWATPAQSWKPIVHPPHLRTMTMAQPEPDAPVLVSVARRSARRTAMLGVRPCELAALDRLDTVLTRRPPSPEPVYSPRRADAFVIVVNCSSPASTCFCSSMDTGPHVDGRSATHDLEVTELLDHLEPDAEPRYVVAAISDEGAALLARSNLSGAPATPTDLDAVHADRDRSTRAMSTRLDPDDLADALRSAHDDPRWADLAERCVACGNCTAVCPTCFCTRLDDVGDLSGTKVERWRTWESCFGLEFSRLGDQSVRASIGARYRQWMTHKLSSWNDQYGESGCVGCGRCTTWCPVAIDFVAEARRLAERDEEHP